MRPSRLWGENEARKSSRPLILPLSLCSTRTNGRQTPRFWTVSCRTDRQRKNAAGGQLKCVGSVTGTNAVQKPAWFCKPPVCICTRPEPSCSCAPEMPRDDDRIFRNLRRHAALPSKSLRVVGIDDWRLVCRICCIGGSRSHVIGSWSSLFIMIPDPYQGGSDVGSSSRKGACRDGGRLPAEGAGKMRARRANRPHGLRCAD
jgi:hypothetical protein